MSGGRTLAGRTRVVQVVERFDDILAATRWAVSMANGLQFTLDFDPHLHVRDEVEAEEAR